MRNLATKAKIRANETRNALGLGNEPISNVFQLLEEQGIYLFIKPLEADASAVFMRTNEIHMVVINSKKTLGHQIFSAAHEFSHFLFDKNLMGGVCQVNKYNQDNEVERLADLFASHFLMPEEGILKKLHKRKKNLNRIVMADIVYLQQSFKVSWTSMLYRLLNIGLLSYEEVEDYKYLSITREAHKLGYELDLYKTTNAYIPSQKYIEQAVRAYDNEMISEKKLSEYLAVINTSVEELYTSEVQESEQNA